ncbi:GNAT family N-acetyltransferase [Candidatus Pacearchaeota archaeon]|nr:GNAT family N-acetyltransferase [Candidatus Pacearchaeota archaeon]
MESNIRAIENKDLDSLARIYAETYDYFDVGEIWTPQSAKEMLRYWLNKQPDLCFLAEEMEIQGAFVIGVKPWWDGNHLVDGEIFVHPDYQKKGIGTALLRHVFAEARKKYNVVRWDTFTVRDKYPLNWYKSIGFTEIKEWAMISAVPREVMNKLDSKKR